MDFKRILSELVASFLFFVRRVFQLIVSPYKTLRSISHDDDILQVIYIFIFIGMYFYMAHHLREYGHGPLILFWVTVIHYLLTVSYFALFTLLSNKKHKLGIAPYLLLFAYALIPTLLWFVVTSVLYSLIPPPRTPSFLGKSFSILYVSFSLGVLMWKILVTYLAVRFATGFRFFRILYSLILYCAIVIPYSYLLYRLGVFRIPFL